ncbi:hypothetical protein ACHQM5_017325 [Ranunculus cassubicifolius]
MASSSSYPINPTLIYNKSSSPSRFLTLSHAHPTKFSQIPKPFKALSSAHGHGISIKALGGGSENQSRAMGFHNFRISAVSGGNDGGSGGDGNSGGGGGNGDEGGDKKWSFLSWYLAALKNHPVLTKALTSAILTFIGDLICQLLIDKASTLDVKRTLLFTLLGFILVGPTLHFWYLSLSNMVATPGPTGAFLRLVLDQFLFSPLFIGFFLSTLLTLEGRPSQILPKLQQEWLATVLANWQLWIPFQFLNFLFVPQQFQVLAANVIALAWNVILSFKAHKEILAK